MRTSLAIAAAVLVGSGCTTSLWLTEAERERALRSEPGEQIEVWTEDGVRRRVDGEIFRTLADSDWGPAPSVEVADPGSSLRRWGWGTVIAGTAGAAAGFITVSIKAFAIYGAGGGCGWSTDPNCNAASAESAHDTYERDLIIVGSVTGVVIAAGIGLLIPGYLRADDLFLDESASICLVPTFEGAAVVGRF